MRNMVLCHQPRRSLGPGNQGSVNETIGSRPSFTGGIQCVTRAIMRVKSLGSLGS